MSWWAVDVQGGAGDREALAAWLVLQTGQAVEERPDGTLVTFASDESSAEELIGRLRAERGDGVAASRRRIEETDWRTRWREGLGPHHLGRLTVLPSWVQYAPLPHEVLLVIDPETAFGSGEHGSTRAALALLEAHLRPGDRVLDLGSGSGILAIAALLLGAARAVGIEEDAEANSVALRNAERNGVADRAAFLLGDAGSLAPLVGPVEVLLSNILRDVNITLLPSVRTALRPAGLGIFAGMEESEAGGFRAALRTAGFDLISEVTDAGWWAVAARSG